MGGAKLGLKRRGAKRGEPQVGAAYANDDRSGVTRGCVDYLVLLNDLNKRNGLKSVHRSADVEG